MEAHGAAGRYDERLINLLGAHRRVQRAQEELEQTRAADVNERNELVNLPQQTRSTHHRRTVLRIHAR